MVLTSSRTLRCALRRSRFVIRAENHRSTRFIQEAYVGVKWKWKRGCRASHRWIAALSKGARVVENDVDIERIGHGRV
jgi:hypothetical protein